MPSMFYCHNCQNRTLLRNTDLICARCGSDFIEETEIPMVQMPFLAPPVFNPGPSLFEQNLPPSPGFRAEPQASPRSPYVVRQRSQSVPRTSPIGPNARVPRRADNHPENIPFHQRPQGHVMYIQRATGIRPNINAADRDLPPLVPLNILRQSLGRVLDARQRLNTDPDMLYSDEELDQPMPAENEALLEGAAMNINPAARGYLVELILRPNEFGGTIDEMLNDLVNGLGVEAPRPEHLTEEEIEKVPMVKVEQSHIDNKTQCSTCFEDFVLDEDVSRLDCAHIFHVNCVKPWLRLHNTCPMCRTQVNPVTWTTGSAHQSQAAPEEVTTPLERAPVGMIDPDDLD